MYDQYQAQGALQQQGTDSQMAMNAPMLQESIQQNQAILVEQTNPRKIVKEIILRLQGKEERADGSVVQVAEAKVNKAGIDNIWFILDSHINQNVILSHLKDTEIANIMDALQNDVVDDLSLNWKEYGVKKKTDLDTITDSVLVNIFVALKRAEGQNEKNWLSKISVESISNAPSMSSGKKENWLSKFRL